MRDKLLRLVRAKGGVSFVEIQRAFPEERGDQALHAPGFPNVLLWTGLSKALGDMIVACLRDGTLTVTPTSALVYMCDGAYPMLPIAKRAHQYKTPHWLPVAFNAPCTQEERRAAIAANVAEMTAEWAGEGSK